MALQISLVPESWTKLCLHYRVPVAQIRVFAESALHMSQSLYPHKLRAGLVIAL